MPGSWACWRRSGCEPQFDRRVGRETQLLTFAEHVRVHGPRHAGDCKPDGEWVRQLTQADANKTEAEETADAAATDVVGIHRALRHARAGIVGIAIESVVLRTVERSLQREEGERRWNEARFRVGHACAAFFVEGDVVATAHVDGVQRRQHRHHVPRRRLDAFEEKFGVSAAAGEHWVRAVLDSYLTERVQC